MSKTFHFMQDPSRVIEIEPAIYNDGSDGRVVLQIVCTWGMLFPDGPGTKPVYYFRHANTDSYRFCGFVELGDGPFSVQQGGHYRDVAQADAKVLPYAALPDGSYGMGSDEPYTRHVFYPDGTAMWREADVLDVKTEPFPFVMADCKALFDQLYMVTQPCTLHGIYEGKEIFGLGCNERYYMPVDGPKFGDHLVYACIYGIGLRKDGQREATLVVTDEHGHGSGFYWFEGDLAVSDDVQVEADWTPLPYMTDGTCAWTKCSYRIGDKQLFFESKWGSKGFTEHPRVEKYGQSQCFGVWYEGGPQNTHAYDLTFCENMGAYYDDLRANGMMRE